MTVKHQPSFPYYGSKGYLSSWIVSNLPEHNAYVEPFAGSASVLVAKPPSRFEVINDIDGNIVNFYRVLRNNPDDLISLLQLTPYARDEYLYCRDSDSSNVPEVERARRFYVRACQSYGGIGGSSGFSSGTFKKTGAKPATFKRRIDDRLSWLADRLRNVEIQNTNALKLISVWGESPRAVLYLDPPYLGETRVSRNAYVYEAADQEFHEKMLDAIVRIPAAVVLSGYSSELYRSYLHGWKKIERTVMLSSSNKKNQDRTEVLWIKESCSMGEKAA